MPERRVDVTARYAAYGIAKTQKHQSKTQADTKNSDFRAGQNRAAAGENHQKHCTDALS